MFLRLASFRKNQKETHLYGQLHDITGRGKTLRKTSITLQTRDKQAHSPRLYQDREDRCVGDEPQKEKKLLVFLPNDTYSEHTRVGPQNNTLMLLAETWWQYRLITQRYSPYIM